MNLVVMVFRTRRIWRANCRAKGCCRRSGRESRATEPIFTYVPLFGVCELSTFFGYRG